MRDIRHKTLLHLGEVGELLDLALQAVGHTVEGSGEGGNDILALLGDAHLEIAAGELLARFSGHANRRHDEAHDHPADTADEQHEGQAGDAQGLLHKEQRRLRVLQAVADVELIPPGNRNGELRPNDDAGDLGAEVVVRVTDCQNCSSELACTARRRSFETTPVSSPKVEESCGATVDASWPGTRSTAMSRLEDAAVIDVRADPSSARTCTRSTASEASRIPARHSWLDSSRAAPG